MRGWFKYDFKPLRDIFQKYNLRLATGDDTIFAAWVRAWVKGMKTEDDEWYCNFCLYCEELIEEYHRAMRNKVGYWAICVCASCGKKTAWHKASGLRYLLEDFDSHGNPKR